MPHLIMKKAPRELVQVARGHHGWHYEWRVYRADGTYWVASTFFAEDKDRSNDE